MTSGDCEVYTNDEAAWVGQPQHFSSIIALSSELIHWQIRVFGIESGLVMSIGTVFFYVKC